MAQKRNALIGAVLGSALLVIGGHEGLKTVAHKPVPTDPWSICYGSTKGVKKGDVVTVEQCNARFSEELQSYNQPYEKLNIELTPGQHIAFLDTTYNIGVGATLSSTFYRLLSYGKVDQACDSILNWKFVAGNDCSRTNYCPGVWKRRVDMYRLCKGQITIEQATKRLNVYGGSKPDGAKDKAN